MTINELQIQLDISSGNELEVLSEHAYTTSYGYLFVDSSDGQCYLLDKCGKLDDISKVKCIQDYTFHHCKSLNSIIIPDSIKSIGDGAFESCISLKSIIIPSLVNSIGHWAFVNCTSLENITIPDLVKIIGDNAFVNCTSLNEVIFKGKTINQVEKMDKYPWGIKDRSVIRCR